MDTWRAFAACRGKTTLMYGPLIEAPRTTIKRVNEAIALCHTCPVELECKIDAAVSRAYVDKGCVAGGIYWPVRGSRHGQWALAVLDNCPCAKCEHKRAIEEEKARRRGAA